MPFDPNTQRMLEYQARRMHQALHQTYPPDRKEAALIQRRVDDILDRRPREPIAVASDGEVIWPDSSSWVAEQAYPELPPAKQIAINATPDPEPVLRPEDIVTPTGGVAILERSAENCAYCVRMGRYCGHRR